MSLEQPSTGKFVLSGTSGDWTFLGVIGRGSFANGAKLHLNSTISALCCYWPA